MDDITFNAEEHKYYVKGLEIPHVTGILEAAGLTGRPPGISDDVWGRSGRFGLAVHEACRFHDIETLNVATLDKALVPWLAGWVKFKHDFGIEVFQAVEVKLYSKRWGFAGRMDREHPINNKATLVDIKTPTLKKRATGVQLAAYQIAWEEMTKKKIKQRWAIHLKEDGYSIEPYDDKGDKDVFLACLQKVRAQVQIDNWLKRR